jgi:methionyl-tRNA formyltransferase
LAELSTGALGQPWRVVVFTNIPGGIVYKQIDAAVAPLGHRIVGVVTTPGPPRRRSSSYLDVVAAVRPGIDVIVANHPNRLAAMVAPMRPDLIISGGFPYLIPAEVIALPAVAAINLHPALLPKYRGPCAVEWALRNGDRELGFTIHRLAAGFDTGAILAQGTLPIYDDDDFPALVGRMGALVPDLLHHALQRLARGEDGDPQDETQASYASMFEPEWRIIDWSCPARTIHNQVRSWIGMRDLPAGAIGTLSGEKLVITRTRLIPGNFAGDSMPVPGTIIQRKTDCMVVQCGDGPLEVIAWGPAGA